jgi:hypothetical protein
MASYFWVEGLCECRSTPLLIAFGSTWVGALTSAERGAPFRLSPGGVVERVAWPRQSQTRAGWLARDRNGNGTIDDGSELYGTATIQIVAPGELRHGFKALAVEDSNGDSVVDPQDSAYNDIRVWFDLDLDGQSQEGELRSLAELGVIQLKLRHESVREFDAGLNLCIFEGRGVQQIGRTVREIHLCDIAVRTVPLGPR